MAKVRTLEEPRGVLSRIGKTHSDVAQELNVDPTTVQGVLSGRLKGHWGDAHRVVVALGLKEGVIVADGQSIAAAFKAALAA